MKKAIFRPDALKKGMKLEDIFFSQVKKVVKAKRSKKIIKTIDFAEFDFYDNKTKNAYEIKGINAYPDQYNQVMIGLNKANFFIEQTPKSIKKNLGVLSDKINNLYFIFHFYKEIPYAFSDSEDEDEDEDENDNQFVFYYHKYDAQFPYYKDEDHMHRDGYKQPVFYIPTKYLEILRDDDIKKILKYKLKN